MQYVLSPYYKLKKIAYLKQKFPDAQEVIELDKHENFVLVKNAKKDFIINREIYQFLKFLKQPQTVENLTEKFPEEPYLTDFLQKMLKKGVLIEATKLSQLPDVSKEKQRFGINVKIGKYKIIELLASKKQVEIYLAEHQQKVIIKALKMPEHLSEEKISLLQSKFSKEFELMKILPENPYLSQLIDFNSKQGYAVLKFIKGKTLHQFLRTAVEDSALQIHLIRQIIKAVAFLHSHQIVHGDLHHKNIMVSASNKITLLDFGLSHFHTESNKKNLRKGGLDVYQLGILIYFIIFKKFPFTGFTWDALYTAIQEGVINYTSIKEELVSFIPILKKCLHKNPMKRYKNAQDIDLTI